MSEEEMVQTYARRDLEINMGEGVYLYDTKGKKYLDLMSNYGINILGHSCEAVNHAIIKQLNKLSSLHCSFFNEQRAKLLEMLVQITPRSLQKVYLCNSGAESVEAAIKFAWATTNRREIVSAKLGFHGKTIGALSATTSNPKHRKAFLPLIPGFSQVAYNNVDAIYDAVTTKTAAVILEPIQGESGVRLAYKEYLKAARDICADKGAVLIFDEVQTGFRTGKWTASEHLRIKPDIMCLAKGIANGFPMGATIVTEEVNESLDKGAQTCTFGGNPLACSAAIATINNIEEEKLLEHSKDIGEYFMKKLAAIESNLIRDVRGLGLMIGIELKKKCSQYLKALQDEGVIALSAGSTVLRFLPPLIIQKKHVDFAVEKTAEVLNIN